MHTPASFLQFSGVLFSFADVRSPWSIFSLTEDPEHYKGSSNSAALCRPLSKWLALRSNKSKSFEMRTKCFEPASPAHMLEGLGLTKQDLADDPLLLFDLLRVYDVMDLV
ncbi:hypothetical protein TNCV_2467681 [Trichonephila clavipes]|nr:hypothetical protein TNCV_2467681 [Trichonephila clavipes]